MGVVNCRRNCAIVYVLKLRRAKIRARFTRLEYSRLDKQRGRHSTAIRTAAAVRAYLRNWPINATVPLDKSTLRTRRTLLEIHVQVSAKMDLPSLTDDEAAVERTTRRDMCLHGRAIFRMDLEI